MILAGMNRAPRMYPLSERMLRADDDIHRHSLQPEDGRQERDEDPCVHRVEEHLENAVECHEARGVFRVSLGQLVHTITIAMQRASPIMISPVM